MMTVLYPAASCSGCKLELVVAKSVTPAIYQRSADVSESVTRTSDRTRVSLQKLKIQGTFLLKVTGSCGFVVEIRG